LHSPFQMKHARTFLINKNYYKELLIDNLSLSSIDNNDFKVTLVLLGMNLLNHVMPKHKYSEKQTGCKGCLDIIILYLKHHMYMMNFYSTYIMREFITKKRQNVH